MAGLVEVGLLVGPAEPVANLDLSLIIDEDIVGTHISDLAIYRGEIFRSQKQSIKQIEHLGLFKVAVCAHAIVDLVLKEVGEVVIVDLGVGGNTFILA